MRRRPIAASAVAVACIAVTLGAPTVAEAKTGKEIKICWQAPSASVNVTLRVVLDGPNSRSKRLANGECKSWSVKPGQYKVAAPEIYEDGGTFDQIGAVGLNAYCGSAPAPNNSWYVNSVTATVKRFKNPYQTYELTDNQQFSTNVQKNHQTAINFRARCYQYISG